MKYPRICYVVILLIILTSCAEGNMTNVTNSSNESTTQTNTINSITTTTATQNSFAEANDITTHSDNTLITNSNGFLEGNDSVEESYYLNVNGTTVITSNMYFNNSPRCAMLPFTTVMNALGATTEWENASVARIMFREKEYILNTSEKQLVESGQSANYIIPTPGSKVYCQVIENEFLLDHLTFKTSLLMMGLPITINVDYDTYTVEIFE